MIKYERIITDEEQNILKYDLLDIKDWINKAIEGKINNCLKRAALSYKEQAKEQGIMMIPSNDTDCAKALFESKTYKNRLERDNELKYITK